MTDKYILKDGVPAKEDNLIAWDTWFDAHTEERTVARTEVGALTISTMFLGIDYNFSGEGPPILYETNIHPKDDNPWQERHSTRDDALAGHQRAVDSLSDQEGGA